MQPIKVFYSYAHEDQALRDELEKHLGTLKRQGLIEQWHDRDISAGKDWKHEIDIYLNRAQIILLLISKDFIHSDYCYGIELSRAIQRCEAHEVTIIPILLRPCDWEGLPFSKYQVLPKNQHPISSRYWHNHDEAFREVAKGIRDVVQQWIDFQQMIETGEMQPLSALIKLPQNLPSTDRIKRAPTTNKSHANNTSRMLAETGISEIPIGIHRLPTKRRKTPIYETSQGLKEASQASNRRFISQFFSRKELERCSKKNSGFALALYFLVDVIALSMLVGNWLGSIKLTWLIIPVALLLFVWGLFNINNPTAIVLSLFFGGMWGLIATHYESWQPIAILAVVATITCLHIFLFRKHMKQGLFALV